VIFNANPLMRFDGYYVLADWLEIPNLRERSNRFLKNVMLEHCLGVEVHPEPYMALWRKCLFIAYAVVSYIYRWVVTFGILYFLYNFLRPYKLEVISTLLTIAAFASLTGWPIGRLIRNIYKRGRLPDMKRWRVMVSSTVLLGVIAFLCLVPVPLSRVRCVGVVQPQAKARAYLYVRYSGTLEELRVRPGDHVQKGDVVARFRNRDLEAEYEAARLEAATQGFHLDLLRQRQREIRGEPKEKARVVVEEHETQTKKIEAETKMAGLDHIRQEELELRAPSDGVIGEAPKPDAVGKWFEKDAKTHFCTIIAPQQLRVALPLEPAEFNRLKENLEGMTPAARATRRLLLNQRVSLSGQQKTLSATLDELKKQARGLKIWLDPESKVDGEAQVNSLAEPPQPLATVLNHLLPRFGLGYVVLSQPGDPHDGWVQIRPGQERGDPAGGRALADLDVTIRVQGRDAKTWKGRIRSLPESQALTLPLELTAKAGGPIAIKPQALSEHQLTKGDVHADPLTPQTQQFIVYVDLLLDDDDAVVPGVMAQVKVRCQPETCVHWLWRTVNDTFHLGLW
jgi:multidrug efflux pump subunit AcrA (membrane-fusion protein)